MGSRPGACERCGLWLQREVVKDPLSAEPWPLLAGQRALVPLTLLLPWGWPWTAHQRWGGKIGAQQMCRGRLVNRGTGLLQPFTGVRALENQREVAGSAYILP